jgi:hypothetical protein
MPMYKLIGYNKAGHALYRSTRGSNKNEAINLVLERSMHTTGKFKETAMGECVWCSDLLCCVSCLCCVAGLLRYVVTPAR